MGYENGFGFGFGKKRGIVLEVCAFFLSGLGIRAHTGGRRRSWMMRVHSGGKQRRKAHSGITQWGPPVVLHNTAHVWRRRARCTGASCTGVGSDRCATIGRCTEVCDGG
ncbi:hypothetical protein U1Q18_044175 [Sarracenia purpurea var. burkii]